jgi:hypothetical protein
MQEMMSRLRDDRRLRDLDLARPNRWITGAGAGSPRSRRAHTKLLDRFTANEEPLAYVQSTAGARFLKSAPISLDGNPRAMGAPFSRILWSMQGCRAGLRGIGMNYVSRTIDDDPG